MFLFESKKKKWFKHKLDGVEKMIWDQEFKREKTLTIKEDVRKEYDSLAARIHLVEGQIKAQLKTPGKLCDVHNPEKGKEKVHKDKGTCVCEYIETGFIGKDELERLYDQVTLMSIDRDRFIAQIKQMDVDVHGSEPTNEYPDGVQGINQQLEALHELHAMVKQKVKTL